MPLTECVSKCHVNARVSDVGSGSGGLSAGLSDPHNRPSARHKLLQVQILMQFM